MACKTSCMTNLFHDLSNKKKGKSTSQRIIETRLKVGGGTLEKKELYRRLWLLSNKVGSNNLALALCSETGHKNLKNSISLD